MNMKDVVYKTISNYEQLSTCYHEAGHIVYALLSNCRVEKAHLVSEIEAYVYYDVPEFWNTKNIQKKMSLLKKEIGIRYSGILAEKIFYENLHGNVNIPNFIKIGSSSDFKSVTDILTKHNIKKQGLERKKFKNKIKTKVIRQLRHNWNSIALIANLLLKDKYIDYNKIKKVLIKDSKRWSQIFKKIENC